MSVGLPVYNGEAYLEEALKSLLAQDFRDFELIISDNGSTDATERICRAFCAADDRVRYERHDLNRGASWNFNHVVSLARGEYFRWASHDDLCDPTHLRRCVEALDAASSDVVLVQSRTMLIDEGDRYIEPNEDGFDTSGAAPHRRLRLVAQRVRHSNALFGLIRRDALLRTNLLGGYEAADYVLLSELSLIGEFVQLPEYLFYKRIHPQRPLLVSRNARDVARWFDTSSQRRLYFPQTRLIMEHAKLVRRAPLPVAERVRAFLALHHWVRRQWRMLVKEMLAPIFPRMGEYRS